MPKYRIQDPQSGKTVVLEGDSPPTEQELEQVFASVYKPSMIGQMSALVTPQDQGAPPTTIGGYLKALSPFPIPTNMSNVQKMLSPVAGQVGPSQLLEQAGGQVQKAVVPSFEKIATENPVARNYPATNALLSTLPAVAVDATAGVFKPSYIQQQIGVEGLPMAAKAPEAISTLKAIDKSVIAPVQQFATGVPAKDYLRLSKSPEMIAPEFAGGPPSKAAAGAAVGEAKKSANIYDPITAVQESDALNTIKKLGENRTEKFLSNPTNIKRLVRQELTPQEANNFGNELNAALKTWVPGKSPGNYRVYAIYKDAVDDYLASQGTGIKTAQAAYGQAAQRAKLLSPLPLTKYGQPSIGRTGLMSILLGGAAPEGSDLVRSLITPALASSPAVNSVARAQMTQVLKAMSNPVLTPLLGRVLLEKLKKKGNQNAGQ